MASLVVLRIFNESTLAILGFNICETDSWACHCLTLFFIALLSELDTERLFCGLGRALTLNNNSDILIVDLLGLT